MPWPPPVWSPLRVWVAALGMLGVLSACGRVGYDRVVVGDGPSSDRRDVPGDQPVELASDSGPALDLGSAEVVPPDAGVPDAPVDMADAPADITPAIDRAVDRPPDQALPGDVAPAPNPPVFTRSGSAVGNAAQLHVRRWQRQQPVPGGEHRVETETRNVTAVSFGGRALTRLGADTAGPAATYLYGLSNPPVGQQPLAVTLSDTSDIVVVAASFTGVRQTATPGGSVAHRDRGPVSLLVPSAPGEHVVDSLCLDEVSESPRVGHGTDRAGAADGQQLRGSR